MSHRICKAYIVGLGVPDRVSHLSGRLAKDLIGMGGEAGRRMHGYSDAGEKEPERGGEKQKGRPRITTWPMEPMVPILVSSGRPKIPVTGLLPSCEHVIEVGKRLISDRPSRWLTLPVNSGGWFESLRQKLDGRVQEHGKQAGIHGNGPVLPLCLGLPLLRIDGYEREFFLKALEAGIDEAGGWRALLLTCWEIEYLTHRPWHHSVYWAPIWKRRLQRAIVTSNGGGNIA